MAPPKVAIWRTDWLGGSETFIANQLGCLSRWSGEPLAISRVTGSPYDDLPARTFLDSGSLRRQRRIAFEKSRFSPALARQLRRSRARLVHAHFGPDATLIAPTAARAKVPLIATFHGFDATSLPQSGSEYAQMYRRRLPGLFAGCTLILAVSGFIAGRVRALGAPADKVVVHHIGVRTQAPAALNPDGPIVFVGRLLEKKGVADLLAAVARLPEQLRCRRIEIIGDGELLPELRRQAAALELNVSFLGAQPPEEVRTRMAGAAVFAAPSKTAASGDCEGLPTTVQEAAALGLPILSTRHAGIPELITDGVTGLLADEGDVAGLATGLTSLLSNPALGAQLGDKARAVVAAEFDIVAQTAKLEELYDLALNRNLAAIQGH